MKRYERINIIHVIYSFFYVFQFSLLLFIRFSFILRLKLNFQDNNCFADGNLFYVFKMAFSVRTIFSFVITFKNI